MSARRSNGGSKILGSAMILLWRWRGDDNHLTNSVINHGASSELPRREHALEIRHCAQNTHHEIPVIFARRFRVMIFPNVKQALRYAIWRIWHIQNVALHIGIRARQFRFEFL